MSSALPVILALVGGGIFVVLIVAWARKQSERAHANVQRLAGQLGLTMAPVTTYLGFKSEPRASGLFRGKPAELFTYTTGSGKSRVRWTALALTPHDTGGFTFTLSRQGFGTKVSELFGAREITVGDPAFDASWFIQTNQPEFMQAALIPELRARVTAALERTGRSGSFKLEKERVIYAEMGDFSDVERCDRLARVAEPLSDLADAAEVFAESKSGRSPRA